MPAFVLLTRLSSDALHRPELKELLHSLPAQS